MCLILFAYKVHPRYRLLLLANRDEFYDRATAPLDFWPGQPNLLAGRDLVQGGTWMGVTRTGRLAAITNYRDPQSIKTDAPSRGHLVADYLLTHTAPADYLRRIRPQAARYNGFNLIVGDATGLFWFSNRAADATLALAPGIYGLSNHLLDTPWPKVQQGKSALIELLAQPDALSEEAFFTLLQSQVIAPDAQLPQTGVDRQWERMLSPIHITSDTYGTRSSTVLWIDAGGILHCAERTWQPAQTVPQAAATRRFTFKVV
jgi:uncharacterized protein with NRDE domain